MLQAEIKLHDDLLLLVLSRFPFTFYETHFIRYGTGCQNELRLCKPVIHSDLLPDKPGIFPEHKILHTAMSCFQLG